MLVEDAQRKEEKKFNLDVPDGLSSSWPESGKKQAKEWNATLEEVLFHGMGCL